MQEVEVQLWQMMVAVGVGAVVIGMIGLVGLLGYLVFKRGESG